MSNPTQQLNLLKAQLEASLNQSQLDLQNSLKPLHTAVKSAKHQHTDTKNALKNAKNAAEEAKRIAKDAATALKASENAVKDQQTVLENTFNADQVTLKNQIAESQRSIMAARLASKAKA